MNLSEIKNNRMSEPDKLYQDIINIDISNQVFYIEQNNSLETIAYTNNDISVGIFCECVSIFISKSILTITRKLQDFLYCNNWIIDGKNVYIFFVDFVTIDDNTVRYKTSDNMIIQDLITKVKSYPNELK